MQNHGGWAEWDGPGGRRPGVGVLRSDDHGHSIAKGLPSDFGFPIVVHPHDADTVYVLELLEKYFLLLTDVPKARVQQLLPNSLEAKFALAAAIVEDFHGVGAAGAARAEYDRVHRDGGIPDDLPTVAIDPTLLRDGTIWLPAALAAAGLASSNSDGRRLIQGGGVRVDGTVQSDAKAQLPPGSYVLQVGKAKAARVVVPG